jgi:hypothetical protein
LDRFDHPAVRAARHLVRSCRETPADVVYLGDSLASFVAPEDSDRRRLPEMIADELPLGATLHAAHGGGFHPGLFREFLRLIGDVPNPPVAVLPLCIRLCHVPWVEHPLYGYRGAMERLRRMTPATPTWRIRAALARSADDDVARVAALRYPTLAGDLAIGDYVAQLKDPSRYGLDETERLRLLYAYHHGAILSPDAPALDAIAQLGADLRSRGWPVVAYESPIPVERGEALWGPSLRRLAADGYALLRDAFRRGYGDGACILETGLAFDDSQILDPDDACEHLNERGRKRLAAEIADAVRRAHGRSRG